MEAAHTSAPPSATLLVEGQTASVIAEAEVVSQDTHLQPHLRRCLVTGEMLPKTELLRFVVGPDQALYPDLAQNLPGRGLWVSATRDAVITAAKKNLFAKAAKTAVKIPPDLVDHVAQLLHKRCLDFMGLSKRSGTAVLGQTQVEAELKSGKLVLLLLADDAGTNLTAYRATKNLKISNRFTRRELGAALGHEQLVYLGFKRHALTGKLEAEMERLEKIAPLNDTNSHTINGRMDSRIE